MKNWKAAGVSDSFTLVDRGVLATIRPTAWNRVLLEKLIVAQVVKSPAFVGL
jgi:hypothetical protein